MWVWIQQRIQILCIFSFFFGLWICFHVGCGSSPGSEATPELSILSESSLEKVVQDTPGQESNVLADAAMESAPETSNVSDVPEEKKEEDGEHSVEFSGQESTMDTTSTTCPRLPGPADTLRKVVISHPYDSQAKKTGKYEVLHLAMDGTITRPQVFFEMGVAVFGNIHFTPDGQVGILVQDDGTLGVFRFLSSGDVEVVHKAFKGSFYADNIAIDPQGQKAYVLDVNWRNNGGGIYEVSIGCDGRLTDRGMLAPSKSSQSMVLLPNQPQQAVLAAKDVLTSSAGNNTHLLQLGTPLQLLGSADAFGDDEAIVSAGEVTADGKFALFGDNNSFSGIPNRVAIVAISASGLKAVQKISPISDPAAIVASPYNNAVLVLSGEGNALYRLSYDSAATPAFGSPVALTYQGGKPQLPTAAQLLLRGGLKGRVLIAENTAIRQVQFQIDGTIKDLGAYGFGAGITNVVGVIGVQP